MSTTSQPHPSRARTLSRFAECGSAVPPHTQREWYTFHRKRPAFVEPETLHCPKKYRKLWTLHYCMWSCFFLCNLQISFFLNLFIYFCIRIIMNRKRSSLENSSCLKSEGISVLAADLCNGSRAHLEGVAQVSRTVRDAFTGSSPVVSPA